MRVYDDERVAVRDALPPSHRAVGLGQEAREGLAKAAWPGLRLVRHSPNE
jgi:hypothetical protein